ncbi:MAG: hypothetical protein LBH82_00715 [Bacteroidales bacterium]|nr:hypothetical protein [Bacteroidales bacterium]
MVKKQNGNRYRLIFICLFFSVFYWFSLKMSKNYTQTYLFQAEFINTPTNKTLVYQSDTIIPITMNTKGLTLLKYDLRRKNISMDYAAIVASNQQNRNFVTVKKDQIQSFLIQSLNFPDNIVIDDLSAITLEFEPIKQQHAD